MKLIHYIARNGELPGMYVNLTDIASITDVMPRDYQSRRYASFSIETKQSPEPTIVFGEDIGELQRSQSLLLLQWMEYMGVTGTTSDSGVHRAHRIEKGDNHALIDLYQVLYIGALMPLADEKYGFTIILRETGNPINIAFDSEREASRAHVALDNAYGDYLKELNKQGV